MNTDQPKSKVAQPADEELKKHGDQLEKQVKDAAGSQTKDQEDWKDKNP
jgi:hypothetical protein